jgi:hypothetical protein
VATNDYFCQFNTTLCLPLPCELDTVWNLLSWFLPCLSSALVGKLIRRSADLATQYSNSTYNITEAQFFSWNQNIQGSCDGVAVGQRVCKAQVYQSSFARICGQSNSNQCSWRNIPISNCQHFRSHSYELLFHHRHATSSHAIWHRCRLWALLSSCSWSVPHLFPKIRARSILIFTQGIPATTYA